MGQPCTICRHPQRAEIDGALIESQSLRNIAKRFGTTSTSLHRHRKHLPAELTKAKQAEEVANADTLLGRVEALISRLEGIATKAETEKQWRAASGAMREIRGCLTLLGQLSGELKTESRRR